MFLKPDYNLKSIYDIPLAELKAKGIKVVLFDLDSTLMVSKSAEFSEKTLKWLTAAERDFLIAIVTNNHNPNYISKVMKISTFAVVSDAKKPSTKAIKKFLEKIEIPHEKVAIVGDRPLTDILAGKRLKLMTILVDSINAENEGIPTRFIRWLERLSILK